MWAFIIFSPSHAPCLCFFKPQPLPVGSTLAQARQLSPSGYKRGRAVARHGSGYKHELLARSDPSSAAHRLHAWGQGLPLWTSFTSSKKWGHSNPQPPPSKGLGSKRQAHAYTGLQTGHCLELVHGYALDTGTCSTCHMALGMTKRPNEGQVLSKEKLPPGRGS